MLSNKKRQGTRWDIWRRGGIDGGDKGQNKMRVGVQSAKAARMKVLVVPSQSEADAAELADYSLYSLLEFQPELWGLPPFDDWINGALPMDLIVFDGQFIDGFLVESPEKDDSLPDQVCGIFFGWAKVSILKDLKVVVCIARELSSTSGRKIQLSSIDGDGDQLSAERVNLALTSYIRGFNNEGNKHLNSGISKDDVCIARSSLELPMFRSPESNGV